MKKKKLRLYFATITFNGIIKQMFAFGESKEKTKGYLYEEYGTTISIELKRVKIKNSKVLTYLVKEAELESDKGRKMLNDFLNLNSKPNEKNN